MMMRRRGLAGLLPPAFALLMAVPALAGPSWDNGAASYVETSLSPPENLAPDHPAWPVRVRLTQPTDRYRHDILGGVPPWAAMQVEALACAACGGALQVHQAVLGADMVFEDPAPRLWDVTGDQRPEIVVVETSLTRGARLAIWALDARRGLIRLAATPYIGRPQRWLAPVAAADLDGDGRIEIAYVDRPHLARELVILRLEGNQLDEIARLPGLTAHRIGDTGITAGVRPCAAGGVELLLPDADWRRLMAVTLAPSSAQATEVGPLSAGAIKAASKEPCRG